MNECSVCGTECTGVTCGPKCRQQAYRDRQGVPIVGVTNQGVTPSVTPGCNEPINWADPDKDYSTIARKTDGKVLVPGDPGYTGCCIEVDGKWVLKSSLCGMAVYTEHGVGIL